VHENQMKVYRPPWADASENHPQIESDQATKRKPADRGGTAPKERRTAKEDKKKARPIKGKRRRLFQGKTRGRREKGGAKKLVEAVYRKLQQKRGTRLRSKGSRCQKDIRAGGSKKPSGEDSRMVLLGNSSTLSKFAMEEVGRRLHKDEWGDQFVGGEERIQSLRVLRVHHQSGCREKPRSGTDEGGLTRINAFTAHDRQAASRKGEEKVPFITAITNSSELGKFTR